MNKQDKIKDLIRHYKKLLKGKKVCAKGSLTPDGKGTCINVTWYDDQNTEDVLKTLDL